MFVLFVFILFKNVTLQVVLLVSEHSTNRSTIIKKRCCHPIKTLCFISLLKAPPGVSSITSLRMEEQGAELKRMEITLCLWREMNKFHM